jgi:hypothetical protein
MDRIGKNMMIPPLGKTSPRMEITGVELSLVFAWGNSIGLKLSILMEA